MTQRPCKVHGGGAGAGFQQPRRPAEACEAYIQSQRGQGWVIPRKRYDDGGLSGGTMAHGAKAKTVSA